jgi:hypothetical protein
MMEKDARQKAEGALSVVCALHGGRKRAKMTGGKSRAHENHFTNG